MTALFSLVFIANSMMIPIDCNITKFSLHLCIYVNSSFSHLEPFIAK